MNGKRIERTEQNRPQTHTSPCSGSNEKNVKLEIIYCVLNLIAFHIRQCTYVKLFLLQQQRSEKLNFHI